MQLLIYCLCCVYITALAFFLIMSYPRLKCWSYAFKRQERLQNPRKNKLAVLIPARNESLSIGTLFDCLSKQSYLRDLFDVHVIVADGNDPTLEIASQYGYTTLVASAQTCKSDALDLCITGILKEDPYRYDAYIVIDADCALDPNFLEEMNNALLSGADILCSKKVVKNYFFGESRTCSMSASCNGVIWTLLDNMGNKYKSEKGYPCFTVGTGLMLTAKVIREKGGWPYKATMTEDVELMHDGVLDHRRFFYYEHAVLYMEEAQKLSETNKRRRRWMTGVADSERLYRKKVKQGCSFEERYYTSALNHIYGYVGTSVVFSAVCAVLAVILALLGADEWGQLALLALLGISVIYISFFIMTVVAIACEKDNIKLSPYRKVALALIHPLFYMQYIRIVGKALLSSSKKRSWEAIERVDFSAKK